MAFNFYDMCYLLFIRKVNLEFKIKPREDEKHTHTHEEKLVYPSE